MRLEVVAPFATVIAVQGDQRRFVAVEGQTFDVDEPTGLALLRDVPACLRIPEAAVAPVAVPEVEEAVTVIEAPVVEMVEVPEAIAAPAFTRQIARKPTVKIGPKPTAKKGKK